MTSWCRTVGPGPRSGGGTGDAGAWLGTAAGADGVNRDAIGAVVEIKRDTAVERHEITLGRARVRSVGCTSAWATPIGPNCGRPGRTGWREIGKSARRIFQILRPGAPVETRTPGFTAESRFCKRDQETAVGTTSVLSISNALRVERHRQLRQDSTAHPYGIADVFITVCILKDPGQAGQCNELS